MICPKCHKDTAFLWATDGIHEKGMHYGVEIKCDGKCRDKYSEFDYNEIKSPVTIAIVDIQVIVKRNSLKMYND